MKEELTKEQMKQISGGNDNMCNILKKMMDNDSYNWGAPEWDWWSLEWDNNHCA